MPHPKATWKAVLDTMNLNRNPDRITMDIRIVGNHRENGRRVEIDFYSPEALQRHIEMCEHMLLNYGMYLTQHADTPNG